MPPLVPQFEAPPRQVPNTQTRVAFLTDPWGTYIEVTGNGSGDFKDFRILTAK